MKPCAALWLAIPLIAAACIACGSSGQQARPCGQSSSSADQGIAAEWPPEGPQILWKRELGPGYSGIVAGNDRLFTMYRSGRAEVVVGLDAGTGETIWEYRYESTPVEGQDTEYGSGPNARPLLADGRLYTIGFAGVMHGLDAATGAVLWSHDLWGELGGTIVELGYSASPVKFRDTIIALVGGAGRGAIAFDSHDGHEVWRNLDVESSYSTPAIMTIHGEAQLVAFTATEVIGADPVSGELLWRYAIRNQYPQNICSPIQIDDDLVFVSTLEAGSRGLKLVNDKPFRVEEQWSSRRVQCFYGAYVRMGDTIYGSSGYSAAPLMAAIDARTGELVWRVRGFALSHLLAIAGRLLLLDDDGKLTLATPGPAGLDVHGEARILSSPALTPPTLVGTVLYARDARDIVALDLRP